MDDREFPTRPVVGIGVVVIDDQRVLLIERGKPPRQGTWSLPGGAQELGETLGEGAVREVREETGLRVEIVCLLDVVDSIERLGTGTPVRFHYTLVDFLAVPRGGRLRPGGDASDVRWVGREEVAGLRLWSAETERIIDLAFEFDDAVCG